MENYYALAAGGALALILLICLVGFRVRYWIKMGAVVVGCKELAPRAGRFARLARFILARLFIFWKIGRLKVDASKAFKRYKGRFIASPNHQTERDAVIIPGLFGLKDLRYFIALNQAVSGVRPPLVAWTGGIPVDFDKPRGPMLALRLAVKTLANENTISFVIFPQGKLVRTNVLLREDFFPGAILLGRKAAENSEDPVALLPIGIFYDRDPAHATLVHRVFNAFGYKRFREFFGEVTYGAVICIGDPILISDLPEENDAATDILFQRVSELSDKAARIGKREK